MEISADGISSRGEDAAEAPAHTSLEISEAPADGVVANKGEGNTRRLVWIGDLSFQGRSLEEVNRAEREPNVDVRDSIARVENLLWIKKNTFYREALDDWREQKNVQDAKIGGSEKRVGEVTNEIYNVIGFFSVFQGVILTAVTQLTQTTLSSPTPTPLCGKVWFPVVLSVLAAVAAVSGIGLKFRNLYELKKEIHLYTRLQWAAQDRERMLVSDAERFLFRKAVEEKPKVAFDDEHLLPKSLAVVAAVIVFTVVLILSYVVIMCDKLVANWH